MPGTRQPTALVLAKGKKHLTKKEIAERESAEVQPQKPKSVKIPKWVPEDQKSTFRKIAKALIALNIYSDLDADTLGRYLIAQQCYLQAAAVAIDAMNRLSTKQAAEWSAIQDRYFKEARNCASDLGLTITSRCRLVIPDGMKEKEPENPFLQLMGEKTYA